MKRIISIFLAALMLLSCMAVMASCGEQAKTEEKTEEKTQEKTGASSSTTTAAPASSAATTSKKPTEAPSSSKAPASSAPAVSVPASSSSSTSNPGTSVPAPGDLPASLSGLSLVAVPQLNGTAWQLTGGKLMGEELTGVALEMMGTYYLVFNGNEVVFITDFQTEDMDLQVFSNYILMPDEGDGDTYGVFTTLNGKLTLAVGAKEMDDTVLYLSQVDPSTVPTPPADDDEAWDDDDWDDGSMSETAIEVPELFYEVTALAPSGLANTGWEMSGVILDLNGTVTEYDKEQAIAMLGEMTLVFVDDDDVVVTNELEGAVPGSVEMFDADSKILSIYYESDASIEYAMLAQVDGEKVLLVGASYDSVSTVVVLTPIDEH